MSMQRTQMIGAALVVGAACVFAYSVWDSVRDSVRPVAVAGMAQAAAAPGTTMSTASVSAVKSAALSKFTSNDVVRAGLSLRLAEYWDALPDQIVQCRLCPRRCTIPDGYRGACRGRVNTGGTLRTMVYGKVVSMNVDPIEKKPLFHFLPSSRSFSLATAGCNMNCLFCQNWQISQASPESAEFVDMKPEDIVAAARKSGAASIAYTYTEPTVFFEFMRDTAKLARAAGISNVWITCGYIEAAPLRELCKYIDAANVDLKGFSDTSYKEYTSGQLEPILLTLKILKAAGVWTEVGNLIIPEANDSTAELSNLCVWVAHELGPDTPLHFLRFRPENKLRDRPPTPVATLERAVGLAKAAGLRYVYTGNVPGGQYESTYCPKCGKAVIVRIGYWIRDVHMKDGTCGYCGAAVAGCWR